MSDMLATVDAHELGAGYRCLVCKAWIFDPGYCDDCRGLARATRALASIPPEAREAIADWLERDGEMMGGRAAIRIALGTRVENAYGWAQHAMDSGGYWGYLPLIASALRGDPGSRGAERA